jgi:hypothetical protein
MLHPADTKINTPPVLEPGIFRLRITYSPVIMLMAIRTPSAPWYISGMYVYFRNILYAKTGFKAMMEQELMN